MTTSKLLRAIPDNRTRIAVIAALAVAEEHKDEVERRFGTYGLECLSDLLGTPRE